MTRRRIATGSLLALLIAGVVVRTLQFAEVVANSTAEKRAMDAVQKLGGCFRAAERSTDLPKWLSGVLPKSFTPKSFAIEVMVLNDTPVTDEWLKVLSGLKNVNTLNLSGTKVTDAGIKELATLKSLKNLELSNTQVTDAGLKELTSLKETLLTLSVSGPNITDAGLKDLAVLTKLQRLHLNCTKVSAAGVAELHKALPIYCNIRHY